MCFVSIITKLTNPADLRKSFAGNNTNAPGEGAFCEVSGFRLVLDGADGEAVASTQVSSRYIGVDEIPGKGIFV